MIVILTDFKNAYYQGIMKGIIKSINPIVEIIELCNVNHFSIIEASWILKNSYQFFPKGTIFLCCVEPKKEKPIIVKTKDYFFIGSDNGLLYETIKENKIELIVEINDINNDIKNNKNNIDINNNREQLYATVAGKLSNELDLLKLGTPPKIKNKLKNKIVFNNKIVMIDNFGNIITNLKQTKNKKTFKLNNKKINFYDDYSKAKKNEIFITLGTSNTLEICIKEGNASKKLKLKAGDNIDLKWI